MVLRGLGSGIEVEGAMSGRGVIALPKDGLEDEDWVECVMNDGAIEISVLLEDSALKGKGGSVNSGPCLVGKI